MKKKKYHIWRRALQIFTVIFFILIPLLNLKSIHWITGTLYSITVGNLEIMDPSLTIQKLFLVKHLALAELLAAGITIVMAIFLGRVFCGWVCPYNFIMEILFKMNSRFRKPVVQSDFSNPGMIQFIRIPLILLVILSITGIPVFTLISFPGIITGFMADVLLWGSIGGGMGLVLVVALIELVSRKRFWCKYVCPVGATLGICHSSLSLQVHFQPEKCSCTGKYSPCNASCPIQLNPKQAGLYPACFNCGECIEMCGHFGGALDFNARKLQKRINTTVSTGF